MTGKVQRLRLAWVTNLQAPYREPLWAELAKFCDLKVFFLAETEFNRSWEYSKASSYQSEVLKSWGVRRGENTHYLLTSRSEIADFVHSFDIVVVGGWDSPAYWQLLFALRRTSVQVVGFYEGTGRSQRFKSGLISSLRSKFYRLCDAAIGVSRASIESLDKMGVKDSRTHYLPNVVDVDFFISHETESDARTSDAAVRWLYVGQLIPRKNVFTLLQALRPVLSNGDHLTIVGDGPMRALLESAIEETDLANSVTMTGHLSDRCTLRRVYANHDVFVLPSEREVFGLVVDEAMAAGCAVVVSAAAGISEELQGVRSCFIAEPTIIGLSKVLEDARAALIVEGRPGSRWRHRPHDLTQDLLQFVTSLHDQASAC